VVTRRKPLPALATSKFKARGQWTASGQRVSAVRINVGAPEDPRPGTLLLFFIPLGFRERLRHIKDDGVPAPSTSCGRRAELHAAMRRAPAPGLGRVPHGQQPAPQESCAHDFSGATSNGVPGVADLVVPSSPRLGPLQKCWTIDFVALEVGGRTSNYTFPPLTRPHSAPPVPIDGTANCGFLGNVSRNG